MPDIDVTNDVLLDGFIAATKFDVIRRRSWTDDDGIVHKSVQVRRDVLGSVTPTGDNSLVRADAYTNQVKTLMVITQFRLRGATTDEGMYTWQPDLVLWQSDYFIVKTLDDFSQFGVGFVHADCESFQYTPDAPRGNPPSDWVGKTDFRWEKQSGIAGALL